MGIELPIIFVVALVAFLLIGCSRGDLPRPTSVEPWVIEAFREKRRQQWLLGIPVGLVAIFFLWVRAYPSAGAGLEVVVFSIAVVVVAGACLFTYRNWRYPKCGAYLGRYAWNRSVCPKWETALWEPVS